MSKSRIALVIQDLYRQGAQYVTAMIARGFVQRGYDVDLVVSKVHQDISKLKPELKPFTVPREVRWINLKSRKASLNIIELACYFRCAQPIAVFSMSENYDWAVGFAMWLCGSRRPKFFPVEHGAFLEKPIKLNWLQRMRQWVWCRHVALQLAVSPGVKIALANLHHRFTADKIYVVSNPVIDEIYWQKVSSLPQHPWLRNKSGKVFVAAGAHVLLKRYDILIKAFARLGEKSARLIIFGDGQETSTYEDLIAKLGVKGMVSLPGFTENLPAEVKSADAFVVSSETESFSIVLVEALAAGTPVISTDCPLGPPDILEHGKHGIMCKVGDVQSLTDALREVINGNGIKPTEAAWNKYTLEKVITNYETAMKLAGCAMKGMI